MKRYRTLMIKYEALHISFKQSGVADSQITRNSIRKIFLLLEIDTIAKFLLFKMKYVIDGGSLLIIDTYYYFVIPIRE